jgi:hypothetical protein
MVCGSNHRVIFPAVARRSLDVAESFFSRSLNLKIGTSVVLVLLEQIYHGFPQNEIFIETFTC